MNQLAYKDTAQQIIQGIGGKDNLKSANHCASRLRLILIDETKVNHEIIDGIDMVKGSFLMNEQYHLILGTGHVNETYQALSELTMIKNASDTTYPNTSRDKKEFFLVRAIKTLSDIFIPIIPAIVAGGLLMALHNLLITKDLFFDNMSLLDVFPQLIGIASLIGYVANAPFIFLPVLIAFSATRIFGGNPFLGAALGMVMVHPDLMNAYEYAMGASTDVTHWQIFGLDVEKVGYQGTVLPILVMSWVLAKLEKLFRTIIPQSLDLFITPLFALSITTLLTFVITGPLLREAGNSLVYYLNMFYTQDGLIGSTVLGLLYAPIVITGMHHSFVAIELKLIADIAKTGGTFIFPIAAMSNMAQGGAAWAALFTTKNKSLKGVASAGGASAIFGITEPAMFGVNLRLRYPFYAAIFAAAGGAAYMAVTNTKATALGGAGIAGIISIEPTHWKAYILGMGIAFFGAFVGTFLLSKTKLNSERMVKSKQSLPASRELFNETANSQKVKEPTAVPEPINTQIKIKESATADTVLEQTNQSTVDSKNNDVGIEQNDESDPESNASNTNHNDKNQEQNNAQPSTAKPAFQSNESIVAQQKINQKRVQQAQTLPVTKISQSNQTQPTIQPNIPSEVQTLTNIEDTRQHTPNIPTNGVNIDLDSENDNETNSNIILKDWVMPLEGDLVALSDVPDIVFSSGAMGAGFAIKPFKDSNKVLSPVSGTVVAIFPTKHAVCIKDSNGLEVFVHVGIDTVGLNGEGFTKLVDVGMHITAGTPILAVDWELVEYKALSTLSPVVFTTMDSGQTVTIKDGIPVILTS